MPRPDGSGRKPEGGKQYRVHVWLFAKDWKRIKKLFPTKKGQQSPSYFIRAAVRKELRAFDAP
jgi:hypothetical protein